MLSKAALGIGAPLLAAVLWGLFAPPRAPVSSPPLRLGVQAAVFGSAALALYATGHGSLASVFAVSSSSTASFSASDREGLQTSRKMRSEAAMGSSSRP